MFAQYAWMSLLRGIPASPFTQTPVLIYKPSLSSYTNINAIHILLLPVSISDVVVCDKTIPSYLFVIVCISHSLSTYHLVT